MVLHYHIYYLSLKQYNINIFLKSQHTSRESDCSNLCTSSKLNFKKSVFCAPGIKTNKQICIFLIWLWWVGRGREPWERTKASGVNYNERHLRHTQCSSPTEELRNDKRRSDDSEGRERTRPGLFMLLFCLCWCASRPWGTAALLSLLFILLLNLC